MALIPRLRRVHLSTTAQALLTAASAVALVRCWAMVARHMVSPAWFDLWLWVDDFQRWVAGSFTLHDLVKPHYEHRILTARLLLLLDSTLFGMNGWVPVACNLLFLALTGWLLWQLARPRAMIATGTDLPPLFWIALSSSVCQTGNLLLPFQVAISSACCLAVVALWLLRAAAEEPGLRAAGLAAGAGLASVAAAFSVGGGVLLTPALLLFLALRRASAIVWGVFTPLTVLGVALFFRHYPRAGAPMPPLLDAHLAIVRLLYVANFLASPLNYFTNAAVWLGLSGVAALLIACIWAARFALRGQKVPSAPAALIALAVFVLLCAAAGTLTVRLNFGPGGALVDRYATIALLFAGAMLGLAGQALEGAAAPARVRNWVFPGLSLVMLVAFNLPYYGRLASGLNQAVNADAQLLVNNLAVQGPTPVIFLGKVDDVVGRVAFLHERKLNMFAPDNFPPAALLAQLKVGSAWPACRGFVDHAYAIDSTGFLLTGWAADPQGQHSAPWIGAIGPDGHLLGTARELEPRPDVAAALGTKTEAFGFDVGFRLTHAAADPEATVVVRIVALFPGEAQPICGLPMQAAIGPVLIEPVAKLRDVAAAALTAPPLAAGFARSGDDKAGVAGWVANQGGGTLDFMVADPAGMGKSLAIPFSLAGESDGRMMVFRFADGAQLQTALPPLFGRPDWRAAVLPAALLGRHPGPVHVVVRGAAIAVGPPVLATALAEWSRIF